MKNNITYQAIEDNGGGLSLFVLDGEKVIYGAIGFEFCGKDLMEAVVSLHNGMNPIEEGWEDNVKNICGVTSQEAYDSLTYEDHKNGGWAVIADENGIYPENMGANGKEAFGSMTEY